MAASVNPFNWKLRNGELRAVTGFRFQRAMGSNFSGVAKCCRRVSDAVVSLNDAISLMTDVELRRRKIGNLLFNLAQPTLLCRRDKEGTRKANDNHRRFCEPFGWSDHMRDEVCKQPQGKFIPVVDFSRCEAKGPCAEACPYDVFEIRKIDPSDYANLGSCRSLKTGPTAEEFRIR
jgi:ferredoxin